MLLFFGFRRFLEGLVRDDDGGPAFGSFAFHQFLNHVKLDALLFILFASSGPFPTFGVSQCINSETGAARRGSHVTFWGAISLMLIQSAGAWPHSRYPKQKDARPLHSPNTEDLQNIQNSPDSHAMDSRFYERAEPLRSCAKRWHIRPEHGLWLHQTVCLLCSQGIPGGRKVATIRSL